MTSKTFHYYVRVIHAMMNDLPLPPHPTRINRSQRRTYQSSYVPTRKHKWNAYMQIWRQEMKDTFLFKK